MSNTEIYNMDCMEGMKQYPDGYFELAIVDPPYGIGMGFDGWDASAKLSRSNDRGKKWDTATPKKEYFDELFRVSTNQIIWGGNYFIDHLKNTRCFVVWDKENGNNNLSDCELAWTSFGTSVRMYRGHIFRGIGNTNYTAIHPTQKPIALYRWLLKNYAKAGDKILDTHLGSGSSRIACYEAGYDFTGYELDKEYFDASEKRFQKYIMQGSIFDEPRG